MKRAYRVEITTARNGIITTVVVADSADLAIPQAKRKVRDTLSAMDHIQSARLLR